MSAISNPLPEDKDGVFEYKPQQPSTSLPLHTPSFFLERFILVKISGNGELKRFIRSDLNLKQLNEVHQHLWLAGLVGPSRSLHHQAVIGRDIILTEQADLHLTWRKDRIYIKPLPDYLLSHGVWKDVILPDERLALDAKGLLLSYLWLIRHPSDWKIATEKGLISDKINWERWTRLSVVLHDNIDHHMLTDVNPRYLHGELRLGRLDFIYRFWCPRKWSFGNLVRGYKFEYHDYPTLIGAYLGWILASFLYITIVLTAMQVGLATDRLKGNTAFQNASYGFTVFSILSPVIGLTLVAAAMVVVVSLNYLFQHKRRTENRQKNQELMRSLDKAGRRDMVH